MKVSDVIDHLKAFLIWLIIVAVLFLLALSLGACSLCRHNAVTQAQWYASQGYEAKIATYKLATSQRVIMGATHGYHAQAVVKIDGRWHWLNGWGDMSDFPLYRVGGFLTVWDIETYRQGVETYEKTGKLVMPETGYRCVEGTNL